MKKSKKILLLFLYLHHIRASSGETEPLRYTKIARATHLPDSTVRGVMACFLQEGIYSRGRLASRGLALLHATFPALDSLADILTPARLFIFPENPKGKERRDLEAMGGMQYRPGVWILRSQGTLRVPGFSIRLDGQEEAEIFHLLEESRVYRKIVKDRRHCRASIEAQKRSDKLLRELSIVFEQTSLFPENNFSKELRIKMLLDEAMHALVL